MLSFKEINPEQLNLSFSQLPNFKSTEDIIPYEGIIGQEKAVHAIDLGLNIDKKEYNIFISGHTGTGKTSYIINKIEHYAKNFSAPEDWCYVYNFEDENIPMAICLNTGTAPKFKEDIKEFINYLLKQVSIFFDSENYEKEKNNIITKYEDKILHISENLNKIAEEKGLNIHENPTEGFVFIPVINGKDLTSDEYSKLSIEQKDLINKNAAELRLISLDVIKQTRTLEKEMDDELKRLDTKIAHNIIFDKVETLKNVYGINERVIKYLNLLSEDIVNNIDAFLIEEDEENNSEKEEKGGKTNNSYAIKEFFKRYDVNIIVTNDKSKGAPVIFEDSPEYYNLFGKIEYENKMGNLVTDFTHIRSGSLHAANGGFLIVNAHQLLNNAETWDTLKRCLKTQSIIIENSKSNMELLPIISLKSEAIPLKIKLILIGSDLIYSLLLDNDLEFQKLFKIKAEFDSDINNNKDNLYELIGYLTNYINKNNFLHVTKEGVIELLKFSSRLAENQNYFSSSIGKLLDIIDMANYFAKKQECKIIEETHIKMAIDEQETMHSLFKNKTLQMYSTKKYIVDLKGSKIGQINGLSVLDYGDSVIGQQHKITAATYAGRKGIINIEREAKMSGSIHSKGVMILSGYVGELLGQEISLSFNASIVFEQLYSGIEGDSASAAELIALLSSLGDIPLKQSLAITGSVNQKGEIQPIGGVNEKIEGFFDICSLFGLDGTHGVIIPQTNIDDLVLSHRVIDAVSKGLFHIYSVKSIEDCLYVLCDDKFKEAFSENIMDVVKKRIMLKLDKYNHILSREKNMD